VCVIIIAYRNRTGDCQRMSRINPQAGSSMDRRCFLVSTGMAALGVTTGTAANGVGRKRKKAYRNKPSAGWLDTPVEFSLCPFWFWNDALSKREIARQIEDFRTHGVYGFLIHPRAGCVSRQQKWQPCSRSFARFSCLVHIFAYCILARWVVLEKDKCVLDPFSTP
jgi:hypothetical protein